MGFYWIQGDETTWVLLGYDAWRIAILSWNADIKMWELDSDFLNIHGDLVIELAQNDSDEAKKEAVEVLISECQEQIDWFNGQIENLNALQEQMRQGEL